MVLQKPVVVACIPAYNEERTIAKVVLKTQRYADKVFVCDDGSVDMTFEIAEKMGATVLRHTKNRGKGEVLKTLFREAMKVNPDIIVTLDADGQHDPSEMPRLIEPIVNGEADLVIGSRYVRGSQSEAPFYRRLGSRLINYLGKGVKGLYVGDTQSGFRAYSKAALRAVASYEAKGYGVEIEQLSMASMRGLRVVEVPITIRYKGLENTSKRSSLFHGLELVETTLRIITEESPLKFLGIPGITLVFIGVGFSIYMLLLFNATRYFSIPIAIISLGSLLVGLTLSIAALMLHGMGRITRRMIETLEKPREEV
ncbi:MAG: glycosyltransferase family 2 protein [Candidatus Geothermarchaeales archaeon]